MLSLCCQAAWWHRVVSRGHLAFRSSCLAGAGLEPRTVKLLGGGVSAVGCAAVLCLSLCRQAAWWHRAVSRGQLAFRSSCLAGTLVAFGRQATWWPGAHCELVSTSYLVALSSQSRRAVTARDLGSSSHTVAELLGGCLLCDVDCVCWCLHIS